MEDLKKEGLTKSIGVSNFMVEHFERLEKVWTIPPAVNQVSDQRCKRPSYHLHPRRKSRVSSKVA